MTTKGLIDYKTLIVLLVIFILSSTAFLIVLRIDLIVHVDLYDYGLQFNTLWANEYWQIKNMLLVFIAGTATLAVLSMIPHFDYSKQPTNTSKWTGTLLPVIAIIYMIFSISSFFRIDDIIQNMLPQYNLIISYVWTADYWNLHSIALTLMIVSLLLLIIPTIRTLKIIELELE